MKYLTIKLRNATAAFCVLVAVAIDTPAAVNASDVFAPTSSQPAFEDAKRAIPWRELSQQDQRIAQYVVRKTAIYRKMPTRTIECDPELFNFLVKHPEAVVNVWNLMGVSKLQVERRGPDRYQATDGMSTAGEVRVLHANYSDDCSNRVLAFVDGEYQQAPLPAPIRVKGLMLLRSKGIKTADGRTRITARLDSFVRFERVGADLIARTIQPLIAQTADHNFIETMKFVGTYSETAARNPAGMQRLSNELKHLDADARAELSAICGRVAKRAERYAVVPQKVGVKLANLQQANSAAK